MDTLWRVGFQVHDYLEIPTFSRFGIEREKEAGKDRQQRFRNGVTHDDRNGVTKKSVNGCR